MRTWCGLDKYDELNQLDIDIDTNLNQSSSIMLLLLLLSSVITWSMLLLAKEHRWRFAG